MSFAITAAQAAPPFLLASSFLAPLVSLGISGAQAQQTASTEQLPPIEVSPPGDQNRTRAKPAFDEGSARAARAARTHTVNNPNPAPGTGANVASQGDGQGGGGNVVQEILRHRRHSLDRHHRRKRSRTRRRKRCKRSSPRRRACS